MQLNNCKIEEHYTTEKTMQCQGAYQVCNPQQAFNAVAIYEPIRVEPVPTRPGSLNQWKDQAWSSPAQLQLRSVTNHGMPAWHGCNYGNKLEEFINHLAAVAAISSKIA